VNLGSGLGDLSYSTLVHPGDTWPEMRASLEAHLPLVKQAVSPSEPFGVSLRMSGSSVETLSAHADELESLIEFLHEHDLYVYTVNAFPHGPFKGGMVKERVYEPDWANAERLNYTIGVADLLAAITIDGVAPSIQTAPLAFAANVSGEPYVARFTEAILRLVTHLAALEDRTGRRVKLALEPEPACYLETTDETVRYFVERLYSDEAVRSFARVSGRPVSEAIGLLRRHVGVVFDIGHQAVGFEDIPASLSKLVAAGIPIFKLQEAAALWVPQVDRISIEELKRFTGTIYLTQTSELRDDVLTKYLNLEDAIAAYDADPGPRQWRTHFHVPVFLDDLGPFRTTRFAVEQALAMHRATPLSDHLEIETYTWDVLPEHLKTGNIDEYVCRELDWVAAQLSPPAVV